MDTILDLHPEVDWSVLRAISVDDHDSSRLEVAVDGVVLHGDLIHLAR